MKRMKYRKLLVFLPMLLLALSACTRDPKVKAQRYVENGNKFFNRGKYKEASIMYRNALKSDGRDGEAYYRLALTDLKLYAFGDAFRALINTVELQPNNDDAKNQLAKLYLISALQQSGNPQRETEAQNSVEDLANQLLKHDPNSYDGHRLLGQLALMRSDTDTALREFEAANNAKSYQPEVLLPYVQALAAKNRFPEAEKLAYQMIDKDKTYGTMYDALYAQYIRLNRLDDAEKILKLKMANNPKSTTYMLQLAVYYIAVKRRDDAEAIFRAMANEKEHPDGHLLAGDFFFFRMHEFDRARAEYEAAMKAFPKDKSLYQKRVVELEATRGKNDEANQVLATILKDNPKDSEAIAMRAALMLSTGNRDQINMATADLQSLVTKTPDNYVLRYNLARALRAKGDLEAAVLQLEAAIKLRPDFLKARDLLATLYAIKGDSPKALKEADEILSRDNNDVQAHLVRSGALLSVGDKERAHKELDYIVKSFPQNVEARYQVGYLDYLEKDFKGAEAVFGKLAKDYPKDPRGLAGLTEALAAQNRMPEAITEVRKALQSDPSNQSLQTFLAHLEVRSKDYDDALRIYSDLLKTNPRDASLMFQMAETYRQKGDLNTAAQYFRQDSQMAPNNPQPLLALALILEGTGRADQAGPIYEQILKIQPDHPTALNNLAYIKAEKGVDLEEALTMAQRARQKAPNSNEIADTLGWIYIKKNLSEEAVRMFQDLVTKDPGNATFHYHYGLALLQKGDKPATRRELEQALRDNPSKQQETEIRDVLAKL